MTRIPGNFTGWMCYFWWLFQWVYAPNCDQLWNHRFTLDFPVLQDMFQKEDIGPQSSHIIAFLLPSPRIVHQCAALMPPSTESQRDIVKISKLCKNKHSITGNLQVQSNQQLRVKASVRDKNFQITQQRPWILKFTFVCDESDTLWLVQVIYRNNRIHLLRAMYNQCNNCFLFLD